MYTVKVFIKDTNLDYTFYKVYKTSIENRLGLIKEIEKELKEFDLVDEDNIKFTSAKYETYGIEGGVKKISSKRDEYYNGNYRVIEIKSLNEYV